MMCRLERVLLILLVVLPKFSGFIRQKLCSNRWISPYPRKSRIVHKDKFVTDPEEIKQIMDMLDIPTEEEFTASERLMKRMGNVDNYQRLTIKELEIKWKAFCKETKRKDKTIDWKEFLPYLFEHESQFLTFPEGIPASEESDLLSSTVVVTETELKRLWEAEKNSGIAKTEFRLKESFLYLPDEEDFPLHQKPVDVEDQSGLVQSYQKGKEVVSKQTRGKKQKQQDGKTDNTNSIHQNDAQEVSDDDVIYIPEIELQRIWAERANGSEWGLPQKEFDIVASLLLVDDGRKDVEDYVISHSKELPIEVLKQYYYLPTIPEVLKEKERNHPTYNSTLTKYRDPALTQVSIFPNIFISKALFYSLVSLLFVNSFWNSIF
jgi:hypothetical protein